LYRSILRIKEEMFGLHFKQTTGKRPDQKRQEEQQRM